MQTKNIGKGGIKAVCIAWCFLLAGILSGCAGSGKPYAVVLNGVEILPGETTVQELSDLGFELSDFSGRQMVRDGEGGTTFVYANVYDLTSEAEAMTVYPGIYLLKEGEKIASLSIANDTKSGISLLKCKIVTVTVDIDDYDYEKAEVEGVSFTSLSAKTLAEALSKPKTDTDSKTEWRRGDYTLTVEYENGEVSSLRSSYPGIY